MTIDIQIHSNNMQYRSSKGETKTLIKLFDMASDPQPLVTDSAISSSDQRPFHCDVCQKVFTMRKNLLRHVFHSCQNTHPILCVLPLPDGTRCGKEYRRSDALQKHVEKYHKDQEDRKTRVRELQRFIRQLEGSDCASTDRHPEE